ncbi:MAG: SDR family oxidoreductase [Saprospiraceae bacterium]|nr:SDR family oxidoreductase [Saprospiraceae bacterium]
MEKNFVGKSAIVTGAGSGIGFDIAQQLISEGCQVLINDIDRDLLAAAADRISGGSALITLAGDAGNLPLIQQMIDEVVCHFGRLDIIIANAGITSYGRFLKFTEDQFTDLVNLNLRGSFFLAQAASKQMINQGSGGRIIFMSSVTGLLAHPYLAAYGMTKAALKMLARALVIELAPYGITTNAIAPGAVATERTMSMTPNYDKIWGSYIPTGKASQPSDITRTALFLASSDAEQINGQTITVDGGITGLCAVPDDIDKPDEE